MSEGKFFRPEKKGDERIGERFQEILKGAVRVAFHILFLILLFFAGHQLYVHLLEDSFFQVKEVEIKGCKKIPEKTILSLAKIEGKPNLFTLPLKEISVRVEAHPWVEHVRVRKIFPDRVLIHIEERKPMAILQLEEPFYIDSKGVIFSRVGDRDEYDFPFLTGLTRQMFDKDPAAAKHLIARALEFLRIVDQEKARPLDGVSEIRMEKAFGIHCFTQAEGVEVKMGWDHFGEKLRRLSLIWSDLQKRGVSAGSIDCSDLKRMVVKKNSPQVKLERR
ncbi:MAG: FtsQ-type POTRA domain-containing protein [Deltaproteobacteria bacterium]|nr:FtsQ-type POTRA domain-containing protein [Deltaproteobacteria bacterium]